MSFNPEDSALLGSPELSAFRAYCVAEKLPNATSEESDLYGAAIYNGRLAAEELAAYGSELDYESRQLLEQAAERGLVARKAMASRHLALVIGMSRRFAFDKDKRYSEDRRADMIGIGNLALMQCMEGYVHLPGRHFAVFATSSVRNAMIGEVMRDIRSNTGRSHRMQRTLIEIDAAYQEARNTNSNADFIEVGESLGYSAERIQKILALTEVRLHSVNDTIGAENSDRLYADVIADPQAQKDLEDAENRHLLAQIWEVASELRRRQVLTQSEWDVFYLRYVEGLSQEATAKKIDSEHTKSFASGAETRVLDKIRKEIESPGYHNKESNADFRLVESGVDLLDILGIPIDKNTNILGIASNVINNMSLTKLQRETMHALMGTNGEHLRPYEYARIRERTIRAVYDAREKAVRRIMGGWTTMSEEEKREMMYALPEEVYPTEISSKATAKNTPRPSQEKLLEQALNFNAKTRLTQQEAARLAAEGSFIDPDILIEVFGSWSTFHNMYRELLRQLR